MKEFVKNHEVERKGSNSIKWGAVEKYGVEDLLPVWIADAEFKTCAKIIEAIKAKADEGVFGYTYIPKTYKEAFIEWERQYGYEVQEEWLRFSTGVLNLLIWACKTRIKEGESILIMTPVYPPFRDVVSSVEGRLVCFELTNKNGIYTIDYDHFEQTIVQEEVKAMIFCNPHNPIGRVWTKDELDRVISICKKHEVYVMSDEIHQDLAFDKFTPCVKALDGSYSSHIATINSNSKSFSIPGCSVAQIVIEDDEFRNAFDKTMYACTNHPAAIVHFAASEAAYRESGEWLGQFKTLVQSNYAELCEGLKEVDIVISPLEGTYLAWLDLSRVYHGEDLVDFFVNEVKLYPNFGETFSSYTPKHIRLNLAISPSTLQIVIERLVNKFK